MVGKLSVTGLQWGYISAARGVMLVRTNASHVLVLDGLKQHWL